MTEFIIISALIGLFGVHFVALYWVAKKGYYWLYWPRSRLVQSSIYIIRHHVLFWKFWCPLYKPNRRCSFICGLWFWRIPNR